MVRLPSNAVLLERINQVKDQVVGLRTDYRSLDSRITTGYVTKDEFMRYITEQKEQQLERHSNYQSQLNAKVSENKFRVYAWAMNIMAGAILSGLAGTMGAMIIRFFQGIPPS